MRPLFLSRFRDQKGHTVDLGGLLYAPQAFLSGILRLTTRYREAKPCLGYRAIRRLNALIQPEWRILEFGAGMSTVWFAARCREVVSIEADSTWFETIQEILRSRHISNVDLRLRHESVFHVVDDLPGSHFDLALIDGIHRDACMRTALSKVKSDGWIYLDNSDLNVGNPEKPIRIAENVLLSHLSEIGRKPEYFTDFAPGCFSVFEGLLAHV